MHTHSDEGQGSELPFAALDRYLATPATPTDDPSIEVWIAQHPEEERALVSLRTFVRQRGRVAGTTSADALWEAMTRRMQAPRVLEDLGVVMAQPK